VDVAWVWFFRCAQRTAGEIVPCQGRSPYLHNERRRFLKSQDAVAQLAEPSAKGLRTRTGAYGVRRQSGAPTPLWLMQGNSITFEIKRRRRSALPPHSIVPCRRDFRTLCLGLPCVLRRCFASWRRTRIMKYEGNVEYRTRNVQGRGTWELGVPCSILDISFIRFLSLAGYFGCGHEPPWSHLMRRCCRTDSVMTQPPHSIPARPQALGMRRKAKGSRRS